jgi:hypothetical protein
MAYCTISRHHPHRKVLDWLTQVVDKIFDQVNGTTGVKARIPEGRDQTETMTT